MTDTSSPFRVRHAMFEDVPVLQRLIERSVRALSVGFYTPQQIESSVRHVFGVDSTLVSDGTYFVVTEGDEIVACGGWSRRGALYGGDQRPMASADTLDPRTDPARIRAFFVAPEHARRGIGRLLLSTCERAAREAGFSRFELMATLPGVPLYQAHGYETIEQVTDVLPDGTAVPVTRMTKTVRDPWLIRRVSAVDTRVLDGLVDVLMDCVEGGASVSFMQPLTRDRATAFWRRVAEDVEGGRRVLIVAEDAAGICGTVQLIVDLPENQPHRADLAKMLVHRRVRRHGLGAALLRASEDAARDAGKTLIVLDTVTGGEGERLYARAGWERVGVIPNYALMPEGPFCSTTMFYRDLGQVPVENPNAPRTRLSVMLAVPDAPAALAWYATALGAKARWNLGSVVAIEIDDALFLIAEPQNNGWSSPSAIGTTTVRVEVFSRDPDAFIARAIAAGANGSLDNIRDHRMPWGTHRQGGFVDPFGHVWLVGDHSPLR